ncbi:MAG: PP2C family protein-serine/threonine phosphatase [Brumimicrobium sp.]
MEEKSHIEELSEKLRRKDFELNSILEISKAINEDKSVDYLLSIYEFVLTERVRIDKFVLFKENDDWETLIKFGVKRKTKSIDIEKDLLRFNEITLIQSSSNEVLNEFNVVIPIIHQERAIAFLLMKKDSSENAGSSKESYGELSFIQTLTNLLVVAIENKRMNKEGIIQARIKKDLEVASEMQKSLFPKDLPSDRRLDLAAQYTSRHEVGGDYYDFIPINDDEFIICIGDVSGKGIGAAMLMANFQAIIRTILSFKKFEFESLIPLLNEKVMETAKGEKFITFFIGHYNAKNRKFKYVNAGHNHPILTNGKRAILLDKGSIGLGMMENVPFLEPDEIDIKPNSTLVLYTDGVVELQNKEGEYFKTDRLIKLIHSFYPLKMEDLNNLIFSKLDEFRQSEELVDDTAIFSCRIF